MNAPADWNDVERWCQSQRVSPDYGQRRFLLAESARSIAAHAVFRDELVLRGAAALELIRDGTRPTTDIDFISLIPPDAFLSHRESLLASVHSCIANRLAQRVPRQVPPPRVSVHISPVMFDTEYTAETLDSAGRLYVATVAHIICEKFYAALSCSRSTPKRLNDLWDIAIFREHTTVSDEEIVRRVQSRMATRPPNEILAAITPVQAAELIEKLAGDVVPPREHQRRLSHAAAASALRLAEQILPYHPAALP